MSDTKSKIETLQSLYHENKERINRLTNREKNILLDIIKGDDKKKIAEKNYISVDTVNWHFKNIKRKLSNPTPYELYKLGLSITIMLDYE